MSDTEVLQFIRRFRSGVNHPQELERLFLNGYCYYFAFMLQKAFQRGELMLTEDKEHVVWRDTDGTAYDIHGKYHGTQLTPLSERKNLLPQFLHSGI